ncbi:DUF1194 domain-containing protein [Rhodovulum sp. DZ06]|uniref:DUF1194 domain-containing protein n=1 Tax=Rhodovulum sp. DZ06 TaxID=3425126 RepID=UPI003D34E0EE
MTGRLRRAARRGPRLGLALACGLWAAGAGPLAQAQTVAQTGACRLALAMALDVSSSVDAAEHRLQADGLADALLDPSVVEALLAPGPDGYVAIAVYEWSGRRQQALIADWALMDGVPAIQALAARVRAAPRSHADFPTALGYALGYGATLLARAPDCRKRTIDMAGDGKNNDGFEPRHAYRAFNFNGITVNALVVGGTTRPSLMRYFRDEVLHGPEAFTEVAEDYSDFARAMRLKLLREVRPALVIGDAR